MLTDGGSIDKEKTAGDGWRTGGVILNKRYYFPNQKITIESKEEKYILSVTTDGTVYWESGRGFRKLQSMWFPKTHILAVVLPDGEEVRIRPTNNGLTLVPKQAVAS